MARQRGPSNSQEARAGRSLNALPRYQIPPEEALPERAGLASGYRYLVAVGYTAGPHAPTDYATVEVLSDQPLTPEEVRNLAEANALSIVAGPEYQRSGFGIPAVNPGDTSIIWAARRA